MLVQFLLLASVIQTPSPAGASWNFSADSLGRLPQGWQTRGNSSSPVYRVEADPDGNRYVSGDSQSSDVQLGVELKAEDRGFPFLSWRWRVWELPKGGDERRSQTLDSAASVYAVFGSRLFPRILK